MKSKPIKPDHDFIYLLRALDLIRRDLAETHGTEFADFLLQEHRPAVERAVRARLHGRHEYEVAQELAELRR